MTSITVAAPSGSHGAETRNARHATRDWAPPESWMGKTLCVTGRVKLCRGVTEAVAYGPDHIRPSPN